MVNNFEVARPRNYGRDYRIRRTRETGRLCTLPPGSVFGLALIIYRNYVIVRPRNHRESQWMAQWSMSL